jgi:predicted nucleotidyltransferase
MNHLKKKLKEFCKAHREIAALYLFGSAVTGRMHQTSDIDIAIMIGKGLSEYDRIEMETTLSNLLARDVDLIIFAHASPLLQHQILKYGHQVYENDSQERVRQEVFSRAEYLDSQFLHKELC